MAPGGRIDRVVLRFDAATRGSRIQVLQGAVGTSTPPELTRSARVYDLCPGADHPPRRVHQHLGRADHRHPRG